MACAQNNPLPLIESRAFRGKEGINLLVHACHSISLLSFVISNFSFLFLFLFFPQCLLLCCDSLLEVTITVIILIPLLCMARVLYIMPVVTSFYYFSS